MRTILHLSDLHFGRIHLPVVEPIIRFAQRVRPSLVVISGDLTQRAKLSEFAEAKKFLQRLPEPYLVVPGNHDVPLYNILLRFLRKHERYRRFIHADLEPFYQDAEMAVVGINTTRALRVAQGRISRAQTERVIGHLKTIEPGRLKVIVTHHPFGIPVALQRRRHPVGRARKTLRQLLDFEPDIFLGGHLHVGHAAAASAQNPAGDYAALVVLAGTATSLRRRSEANSFNVLYLKPRLARVDHFAWREDTGDFALQKSHSFKKNSRGWAEETADNL